MKIKKYSEAKDKNEFLDEFDGIQSKLYSDTDTKIHKKGYCRFLIESFPRIEKDLFIVTDEGESVGRVLVNINETESETAVFGMLEYPKGRQDVLELLMKTTDEWVIKNKLKKSVGPIDLSVWFGNRFKIEETQNSYFWEPTTPIHYYNDIKSFGYNDDKLYHSKFFADAALAFKRTKNGYDLAIHEGHAFERMSLSDDSMIEDLYQLNITSFIDNYMYDSITLDEYKGIYLKLLAGIDLSYSYFIKSPEGKRLGYLFAFLDGDKLIIKSILIDKQKQGQKLAVALLHNAALKAKEAGINQFAGALVRIGNVSDYFFDNVGEQEYAHRYALVSKSY